MTRRARGLLALAGVALSGWTAGLAVPAGADARRGQQVFQRCYACHSVEPGEQGLPGPNLRCVLGRRAGTAPGFEYSRAMREAGERQALVWTRAALDRFLADPEAVVPGTAMAMPGLAAPEDRRDVIDYLAARAPCPDGDRPPSS